MVRALGTKYKRGYGERDAASFPFNEIWREIVPGKPVRSPASIGLTPVEKDDVSSEEVMPQSDRAFYAAKNGGRNRVAVGQKPLLPR